MQIVAKPGPFDATHHFLRCRGRHFSRSDDSWNELKSFRCARTKRPDSVVNLGGCFLNGTTKFIAELRSGDLKTFNQRFVGNDCSFRCCLCE